MEKKKNNFLFEVGEVVVFIYKGYPSLPSKVIERKTEKDFFLSEVYNRSVYFNVYTTEYKCRYSKSKTIFRWKDPEKSLRTYNISKPKGAIDYESDEYSASWIDKNGNILRTIKSGQIGLAHNIVSGQQM